MLRRLLFALMPLLIVGLAVAMLVGLRAMKPEPESREREIRSQAVRVQTVNIEPVTFMVETHGTVEPRTETNLVSQVSGEITSVSPALVAGGFFDEGEVLLTIDSADYEASLARAEANLAQAVLVLEQEEAQAAQARKEWQELGLGEPSELTLREPQLRQAQANARSAEAQVEMARRDLERTKIRAPYTCMVRQKSVDLGQFVSPGTPLAQVFAIDYAEVRLPVTSEEMAFIEIPESYHGDDLAAGGPEVFLEAAIAGQEYRWPARIVRSEGTFDRRSRVLYLVARVERPYDRVDGLDRPPLKMGTFVRAGITGHTVERGFKIPRFAIRGENNLLVVDGDNRLTTRPVEIARMDDQFAYIVGGIEDGETISLTAMEFVAEGMLVNPIRNGDEEADESELAETETTEVAIKKTDDEAASTEVETAGTGG